MAKRTYSRPKREYGKEMDCDICGKNDATAIALVEGAQVAVCHKCAKFGKVLYSLVDMEEQGKVAVGSALASIESEEIVEGYAKLIKKAREEMGLPPAVVAERIREKESYLEKIEKGTLLPSLQVARKLEKELGIKLVESVREEVVPTSTKSSGFLEPTLADLLQAKKTKKK